MDDYTDLVKRAQSAQPEERNIAFDVLVRRFEGMAFSYAYATLRDPHLAEDAVQDAFLLAYQRIGQLRDPRAFPGWLKRIVFTRCDRIIRVQRPPTDAIEARYDLAATTPDPETSVEALEIHSTVHNAIDALPEHERTVTERFYIQGQSQKEIAETLKLPLTTVKKRLQYARGHLRLWFRDLNAAIDLAVYELLPYVERDAYPLTIKSDEDETAG